MVNTLSLVPGLCAPAEYLDQDQPALCMRRLFLPVAHTDGSLVILCADNSAENLSWLRAAYRSATIIQTPRAQLLAELSDRFGAALADDAVNGLARRTPSLSAKTVATGKQIFALAILAAIGGLTSIAWTHIAFDAIAGLTFLGFVGGTLFRAALAWIGGAHREPAAAVFGDDAALPLYTILVPLYREANVLPQLVRSLLLLDYPRDKLDIKLIVEDDDVDTATVADVLAERGPFEVIRVPAGTPRTKPRACNYAFAFARGEFTVIFDAEDRPERDQLRKAVHTFRTGTRELACLQARLNFYNANENWLTRLFALDYALWFDVMLPGLERLGVPMPLGGTSNHFRTSLLRAIGAWDP